MIEFIKKSSVWTMSVISTIFTFVPESLFAKIKLLEKASEEQNIIINRVLTFIIVLLVVTIILSLYLLCRRSVQIKGHNYSIKIKYGNLFKMKSCKKVIPFDECFTTSVGDAPAEIKPNSICGQYLKVNPIQNMQNLIDAAKLVPARSESKYQNKVSYETGKLVPNGDYLLMAFAKLNEKGRGELTRDELVEGLSTLWKEIDTYYGQKDVCIPILGSGITRLKGESLTQQQLLDIIIMSYRLSTYKIKSPYKLHIVCKRQDEFSLNKIGENI